MTHFPSQSAIYYAAVAGDVRGTFRQWLNGEHDASQLAVTYSGMFFDLCRALRRPGVASYPARTRTYSRQDGIEVVSRPVRRGRGWRYHWAMLQNARWILREAKRAGASDLIVMDGVTYWFFLLPAYLRGIRIWASFHTVLWSQGKPPSRLRLVLLQLNGLFLRSCVAGLLAISDDIIEQLQLVCRRELPVAAVFRPTWCRPDFDQLPAPRWEDTVFRVLFVGRVEENKGVLDFVRAAADVVERSPREVKFEICGEGSSKVLVKEAIADLGIARSVELVGHCNRDELLARLGSCHVVVVPTRSDFAEGLNKAAIEAILSKRPLVVSSSVGQAAKLLATAAIEFDGGDAPACARALLQLASSKEFFGSKASAAIAVREHFFDDSCSWKAVLCRLMTERQTVSNEKPASDCGLGGAKHLQ